MGVSAGARAFVAWLILGFSVQTHAVELGSSALLDSPEFDRMKQRYQRCVLVKGSQLLGVTPFAQAVELAPVACHRDLLKIKQFMLSSAFKADVMEDLLGAIAEGVRIDLVNSLLDEKLREEN